MSVSDSETSAPPRMNDTTNTMSLLLTRRSQSISKLTSVGPNEDELQLVLRAAARVPDHGKLTPWRFILFRGDKRSKFGEFLEARLRESRPDAGDLLFERARTIFSATPIVIGVVSRTVPHAKIPEWEQHLSAGAACMNIVLAATALGFGAQWITGWYAYDQKVASHLGLTDHERIAGFIFIGGLAEQPTDRDRPQLAAVVTDYGT
ncbi:nitroreductase [Rhodoligotrophos appendicifer]|uniref:nitroreductase family protein n=1 Tax=Rhodoligotrophos appendicifer TaxID=987056 RepID=UPI001FE3E2C8|nr:nitroreductase [Rhodoligotrophos appendicifer]